MRVQEPYPSASDRQLETDSFGGVRRPCSRAVNDDVGAYCPLGRQNGPDPISFEVEPDSFDAALDRKCESSLSCAPTPSRHETFPHTRTPRGVLFRALPWDIHAVGCVTLGPVRAYAP